MTDDRRQTTTTYPPYPLPDELRTTPAVRVRVYTVPAVADIVRSGLSGVVDGGTVYRGRGWWTDDDGQTTDETSAVVDIVTTPATVDVIGTVARTAARTMGESAVMVTVEPTSAVVLWTTPAVDPVPAIIRDLSDMVTS